MPDTATPQKDSWDKLEAVAKIVAGLGAGVGAILIPLLISQHAESNRQEQVNLQEKNRGGQIYMQIMTEREKSDTDTRAKMFERLMVNYLGEFKQFANRDDEASFRKQVMLLELLSLNFQEFFNARPLFEEVYRRLVKQSDAAKGAAARQRWEVLKAELVRVARNVATRQALVLDNLGQRVHFIVGVGQTYCVRMYDDGEKQSLIGEDSDLLFPESYQQGPCTERGSKIQNDGPDKGPALPTMRRSIEIYVKAVNRALGITELQVTPFDDVFEKGRYRESRKGQGFEFEASYFDLPYMDNIKLSDGSRLAVILRAITRDTEGDKIDLAAIRFRHDFVSLRDRPAFDEMLNRLSDSARGGTSPRAEPAASAWWMWLSNR